MSNGMNGLIENISKYITINSDLEIAIKNYFRKEEYEKNKQIVRIDSKCDKMFFIEKGACLSYYYQEDRKVVSFIYPAKYWITNWSSFYSRKNATEEIKTLINSSLYSITYSDLQDLYDSYPQMERFGRKFLEEQIAYSDEFYRGFSFGTPRERYDRLLMYFPEAIQITTLTNIASMLGISRETLSRIRAKKV